MPDYDPQTMVKHMRKLIDRIELVNADGEPNISNTRAFLDYIESTDLGCLYAIDIRLRQSIGVIFDECELDDVQQSILAQHLVSAIKQELVDAAYNIHATSLARGHKSLLDDAEYWQGKYNNLCQNNKILKAKIRSMKKRNPNSTYILLLSIAIVISLLIVLLLPNAEASVTIEYNIAEIIAAILIGSSATIAGLAYASSKSRENNDDDTDE